MGSYSNFFVVAALAVGASLGFGTFSVARAASVKPQVAVQPSARQSERVSRWVHPAANRILQSVGLDEFEPEPNAPPQGTGGTGTR